jgi:2-isopropylmalate synthase
LALDRFSVIASDAITPMGAVRVKLDGELVEKTGTGDGPVNACYAAIREIAGLPGARLEVYNLTAVDGGMDAQCEATVKVSNAGRTYRGSGISTDIVEASIRAYIQALNAALAASGSETQAEFDHPQRGDTGVH